MKGGLMPRSSRKVSRSGFYHVILRGVNRQNIFFDDKDRRKMLEGLARFCGEEGPELHAYCLMDNHIHLLVRAIDGLDVFVKQISSSYVYYINHKYGRIGHLFQERYKSEPVDDEQYLLTVFRYILQNPHKAGICEVLEYRWSNAQQLDGREGICKFDLIEELAGGVAALREFVLMANDDRCLDVEECPPVSDADAVRVAAYVLGWDPKKLCLYPKLQRDAYILQLRDAGLTGVQIAKMSGLGKALVYRAAWGMSGTK